MNPNCKSVMDCPSPDGNGKQNRVMTVTLVGSGKRPKEALAGLYHCGYDAVFL
ncbi:hypothetical protein [Flavobacterium sp.]|uniref:hypothetical protein n=1 Tax=Flavobacterium sp. TaxID=239 RepID=UPI00286C87C1|nr:hypothetical protein [Flavobacterium sp.]